MNVMKIRIYETNCRCLQLLRLPRHQSAGRSHPPHHQIYQSVSMKEEKVLKKYTTGASSSEGGGGKIIARCAYVGIVQILSTFLAMRQKKIC